MPASTSKGYPYPLTSDPFLPASVDFPALANAIESKSAREAAAVLSAASVLDVGVSGQVRAGRELVVADFTTLLGLGTPVGLWDAGSLTNLGSGGNLVNKGSVPLTAKGLAGTANHAALFAGSTGQALYISDTGAADPFRIKTGSWGCWMRTAKRGTAQTLVSKHTSTQRSWFLGITTGNVPWAYANADAGGATASAPTGITDVCDDRWHFVVSTHDGSVTRLYVDGSLEASVAAVFTLFGSSAPVNVGANTADGSAAAVEPHYGRIAVPFVTPDVLSEDQIRVLMAAKVAHGYSVTPTRSSLAVRRKRKSGPYVAGDFTTQPLHLYNFTAAALTDAGSLNNALTNNGTAVSVAGGDGQSGGAFAFASASSQYLSATDTGLPAGTTARTLSAIFRTSTLARQSIVAYGTTVVGYVEMYLDANGLLTVETQSETLAGPFAADGQTHRVDAVFDPSPADGLKIKLYLDGRLVASGTAFAGGTTLLGVTGFHIGKGRDITTNYFNGLLDGVAVTGYAMAEDEVLSLNAKGSLALPASEKNQGENILAMDATNVYMVFDDVSSQDSIDLRVAA